MKNSIGKPYEREVHSLSRFYIGIRFDEGGADSLFLIIIFMDINFEQAIRLCSNAAYGDTVTIDKFMMI